MKTSSLFLFTFILSCFMSVLTAQNSDCEVYELLPPLSMGDPACGFFNAQGVWINQCSPCGMKIVDDDCVNTPIVSLCALDGFESNSDGYTNDVFIPSLGFCGGGTGTSFNHWIGFTAQTNGVSLVVRTSNCTVNSDGNMLGLQFAIVETDCDSTFTTLDCVGSVGSGGLFNTGIILTANNLIPGNSYYLMVDSFGGGVCDYKIEVLSGTDSEIQIVSSGPNQLCTDVLNPGSFSNTPGSGAIVDVTSNAGTDLTFNWLDLSGNLLASTQGEVLSPNVVRGSLDASFFPSAGTYEVQIVNNSSCCGVCTSTTLEVGNASNVTFAEFSDMSNGVLDCDNDEVNILGGTIDGSIPVVEQWQIEDFNGERINLYQSIVATTGRINDLVLTADIISDIFPFQDSGQVNIVYGFLTAFTDVCYQEAFVTVDFDFAKIDNVSVSSTGELNCITPSVNLTVSADSLDQLDILWTTPDGDIFSDPAQSTIDVGAPGSYVVELTDPITNCSILDTLEVFGNFEIPEFEVLPNQGVLTCDNPSITLEGLLTNNNISAAFEWFGPNGLVLSVSQNIEINEAGVYTLIVSDTNNGCSVEQSVSVLEDTESTITQIDSGIVSSFPFEINPSNNITNPNATYSWQAQNGLQVLNFPIATISQAGVYTFLEDLGHPSCVNQFIYTVQASTLTADAGPDQLLNCNIPTVSLGSASNPGGTEFSYVWSDQNGNIIGTQAFVTVDLAGQYTLMISNTNTGETATDMVWVSGDFEVPSVSVNSTDELTCDNNVLSLFGVSNSPNVSFAWSTPNGNILSNPFQSTISVDEGGLYELVVTSNSNGCTSTTSIEVVPDQEGEETINVPTINTAQTTAALDANEFVNNCTNCSYQWVGQNSGFSSSMPTVAVTQSDIYTCFVTHPENGCVTTLIYTVNFVINLVADAGPDQELTCLVTEVTLGTQNSSQGPGISYEWVDEFGNVVSNALTAVVSSSGQYQLSVSDSNSGENATDIVIVEEDFAMPNFQISEPAILTCDTPTSILEAILFDNLTTANFEWLGPNGLVISNSQSIEVNMSGTYTLTLTNSNNGCSAIASVSVLEDTESTITNIFFGTVSTFPIEIDPSLNMTNTNATYRWEAQNGLQVNNFPVATITAPGDYTFLEEFGNPSCVNRFIYTVSASTLTADAGPAQILTCANPTALLGSSSNPTGSEFSYQWIGPAGNIAGTGAFITVNTPGQYTVTITNNSTGETATDTVVISADMDSPDASIATPEELTCNVNVVALDGISSATNVSYQWTSVNGNITSNPNQPTIFVDQAGLYTLTVTDNNNGCTSSASVEVTSDREGEEDINIPNINTDQTAVVLNANDFVNFCGNCTYQWVGQNTGFMSNGPTATVSQSDIYTCFITFPETGCVTTIVAAVNFISNLIANAGPDQTLTCEISEVIIGSQASSQGPNISYTWVDEQGLVIGNSITLQVSEPGQYQLTVSDSNSGEMTIDLVVVSEDVEAPNLTVSTPQVITCATPQVTLMASASNVSESMADYVWEGVSGNVISTEPTIVVDEPGIYTVTITNTLNGCSSAASVEVAIDTEGQETITVPTIDTNDAVITLNADDFINQCISCTYEWVGQNTGFTSTNPSVEVNQSDVYTCFVTNPQNGCITTLIYTVNFDLMLVADAGPDQTITCDVATVTLGGPNTSVGPNICYEWAGLGGILSDAIKLETAESGDYILTVTDKTTNESVSDTVRVFFDEGNTPEISAEPSGIITCSNMEVLINATLASPGFDLEWTTQDGVILSDPTFEDIAVGAGGVYILEATDPANGCVTTFALLVDEDIEEPELFITTPVLTCAADTISISSVTNLDSTQVSYLWESTEGNILTDPTLDRINLDMEGEYSLTITNLENGCTTKETKTAFRADAVLTSSPISSCTGSIVLDGCELSADAYLNIPCMGGWEPQAGLNIGTFPMATAEVSGTYVFNNVDPQDSCVLLKVIVEVEVEDQSNVDPLVFDLGPDLDFTCAFPTSPSLEIGPDFCSDILEGFEVSWTTTDGCLNNNETSPRISIQCPGTYELTITDTNTGASTTDEITISLTGALFVDQQVTSVSCPGGDDGSASIVVAGGTPPYSYFPAGPTLENLAAGVYDVVVSDAAGCSQTVTFVISEPAAIDPDMFINAAGNVQAQGTGGLPPYTYDWNVGVDSSVIVDPIVGTEYCVTITDANGCTQEDCFLFNPTAVFSPAAKSLSVYPNPSDGHVLIQLDAQSIQQLGTIEIYNTQGVPVSFAKGAVSQEGIALDLSHLPSGAYILHTVIADEIYYQKLIVH